MVTSLAAVTFMYTLVVIATMATFGMVEVQRIIWPAFSMYRVITVPGAFIENVHGVMMAIWVVAVYTTLAVFFFAAVILLSRLLGLKEHSFIVLPLAFLIYFLALVPGNISQVYSYLDAFSVYMGVPLCFILPVFIFIVARVRGMGDERGKGHEKYPKKGT